MGPAWGTGAWLDRTEGKADTRSVIEVDEISRPALTPEFWSTARTIPTVVSVTMLCVIDTCGLLLGACPS